jgi:NADH-ubiquinone oxidoreductase chain 5
MLSSALFVHPDHVVMVEGEFGLPLLIKNLPAILSISGAGLALLLYHRYYRASAVLVEMTETRLGLATYRFFNAKWGIDIIYNRYVIEPALQLGLLTSKILDRGVIELLGPFGLSESLYGSSTRLASADTGSVSAYGLYIFVGVIAITLLLFVPMLTGANQETLNPQLTEGVFGDIRVVLLYGAALFYMTSSLSPTNS